MLGSYLNPLHQNDSLTLDTAPVANPVLPVILLETVMSVELAAGHLSAAVFQLPA